MTNLVTTPIEQVQYGDRVVLDSKLWAIKSIEGPDTHGVYDVYLQDESGTPKMAIAAGLVTIAL